MLDAPSDTPAVRPEDTLAPLMETMAPEAFREIVRLYQESICSSLDAFTQALGAADFDAVRQHAHDLSSLCGQVGSMRPHLLARRIEEACVARRQDDITELAPQLAPAAEDALAELARLDGAAG